MTAVCQRRFSALPCGHNGVMHDEAYVQELLAILTNPAPTGIDPADPDDQADDRTDRYDGFGRDLRVTSAAVAHELMMSIHRHVSAHQPPHRPVAGGPTSCSSSSGTATSTGRSARHSRRSAHGSH